MREGLAWPAGWHNQSRNLLLDPSVALRRPVEPQVSSLVPLEEVQHTAELVREHLDDRWKALSKYNL